MPVFVITAEPFDGPEGRALTDAYHAEARARFPDDFDPASGLSALRRDLAMPGSAFFVVRDGEAPIGCGGLRTLDRATGEVKHMFVQPSHRLRGVGEQILSALEDHARGLGMSRLVLDTSEYLTEAIALYRGRGYVEVEAYNSNHYATHWFAKELTSSSS